MYNSLVSNWFGEKFKSLHPQLQQLHLYGGTLSGAVTLSFGKGLSGWLGKRLAKKLGIPITSTLANSSKVQLDVEIYHDKAGLHWQRNFNQSHLMKSLFLPVGQLPDGYWIEKTGKLTFILTVDIIEQGWYWRILGMQLGKIKLPLWLFPKSRAYKIIEDGFYQFYVGFSLPLLGKLFSYQGKLSCQLAEK